MYYREVNQDDWVACVPKLVEAICNSPSRMICDIDVEATLAHFMAVATRGGAYIVKEKYLVVFDRYKLWYAPTKDIIEEKIVLCIYPENSGSMFDVVRFLIEQRDYLEANHLVIGDFLHQKQEKYGRVLTKLGLTKINSVYAC